MIHENSHNNIKNLFEKSLEVNIDSNLKSLEDISLQVQASRHLKLNLSNNLIPVDLTQEITIISNYP